MKRALIVLTFFAAMLGIIVGTPVPPAIGQAVEWIVPSLVATVGNIPANPREQFFDNTGVILNGGGICTFAAGTTTPLATSSTANMLTPISNPIVFDSSGRFATNVYLGPSSYKFALLNATNVALAQSFGCGSTGSYAAIWTADNLQGGAGTDASVISFGNLPWAQLPTGSNTWTATPTITGAVTLNSTLTVAGALTATTSASFGAAGLAVAFSGVLTSTVQPRVSAFNNATQSVNDSTNTALTFNTEDYQVGTSHSTGSNTSRFVAQSAGIYLICGATSFAANATGVRQAFFRKNGATALNGQQRQQNLAASQVNMNVGCLQTTLALSDYLELVVFQNSGGALNVGDNSAGTESTVQFMRIW